MKIKRHIISGLLCMILLSLLTPCSAFAETENGQETAAAEDNTAGNEAEFVTPDEELPNNTALDDKVPDNKVPDDKIPDNSPSKDESQIYTPSNDEASENTINSENSETLKKAAIQTTSDSDSGIPAEIRSSDNLFTIAGTLDLTDLTFTDNKSSDTDSNGNGYICEKNGDDYVLTLKNVCIQGEDPVQGSGYPKAALIVPYDAKVTIKTDGTSSILDGGIRTPQNGTGIINLFFSGTGNLTINGTIQAGANNDQMTVQNGAKIEISERINIGGSGGGVGSHISVTGTGSSLTVHKATSTAHLSVTAGGTFSAKGTITIRSTEDDRGSINMDKASKIEIVAVPTLMSQDSNGNDIEGILDSIKQYLPVGYKIGYGTVKGGSTQYYTILDSEGYVASTLILQDPPLDNTEEDAGTPGTAAPEEDGQESDISGGTDETPDNTSEDEDASDWRKNRSVPQIKTKETTPKTGDNTKTGIWIFLLLCSSAIIGLSGWYRIRKWNSPANRPREGIMRKG